MADKRSPLKDRPLRNPGQSLDDQIQDFTYDYMLWPTLLALFFVLLAALEWFRYLRTISPSPGLYTFGAVAILAFAAYRFFKGLPRLRALKLGSVNEGDAKRNAVWVLEPKRLPTFLEREPRRLSQEDIHLASFHLGRFVRTAAR